MGVRDPFPLIDIGAGCQIECGVSIYLSDHEAIAPRLVVGPRSFIGRYGMLRIHADLRIGKDVLIAPGCVIATGNHRFERRDIPIAHQGHSKAPVTINDDVWLGAHVVILPGVSVGRGAVVGAGSVVTNDVPEYEIWGGVPARPIGRRP